jgi:hypothetical protein
MYFDKTHSKKDIITIFKSLSVSVDKKLNKREIIELFDEIVKNVIYTKDISNLTELIKFFNEPTKNKKLPIDERSLIMMKSKKIIKYCTNHYYLESAGYQCHDEVFGDCVLIHQYGGIPSVRRACMLFNKSPHDDRKIQPIIPKDVQDELNEKRKIKRTYIKGMTSKSGIFELTFD